MSMAQGFAQGFGMMNNFMQQQDAKEQQAAQSAENNRRYQESIDWRNTTHAEQQKEQEENSKIAAEDRLIKFGLQGVNINDSSMPAEQMAVQRYEQEQQAKARSLAIKESNAAAYYNATNARANQANASSTYTLLKADKLNHDIEAPKQQEVFRRIYDGMGSKEDFDAIKPFAKGMLDRKESFDKFASQYDEIIKSVDSAKTPEEGTQSAFKLLDLANSTEGRDVMQSAFMASLEKRAKLNPNIKGIGMAGFEMIGGKLVPLLDIQYKDGTSAESVPATKNMTREKNDEVVTLDFRTVKNQVNQAYTIQGQLRKAVEDDPQIGVNIGAINKDRYQNGGQGMAVDKFTGDVKVSPAARTQNNATLTVRDKATLIQREIESLRKSGAYNENAIARINQLQKEYDDIMHSSDAKSQPQLVQQQPQPTSVQPAGSDFMGSDFINYHFPPKLKQ